MKQCLLFLIFSTLSIKVLAQGTTNFEIWGLSNETKEQFIENYKKETKKDLNYTYTCSADLAKMGYKESLSMAYIDDMAKYLSNSLNWDSVERIAIIRPFPLTRYNQPKFDSINRKELETFFSNPQIKDSAFVNQVLIHGEQILLKLLMGLHSKNQKFKEECKKVLRKSENLSLCFNSENIIVLSSLLSIPDPETCYFGMKIIENSQIPTDLNKMLFASGALTLIDFLNSNLRTFRKDAIKFLSKRHYLEHSEDYHLWIDWIKAQS